MSGHDGWYVFTPSSGLWLQGDGETWGGFSTAARFTRLTLALAIKERQHPGDSFVYVIELRQW